MKLVIEIPNEVYSHAKDVENRLLTPNEENVLRESVVNGTPLPKGHGRLIDANTLAKQMIKYGWHHSDSTVHEFVEDDLPTIIEADKEE